LLRFDLPQSFQLHTPVFSDRLRRRADVETARVRAEAWSRLARDLSLKKLAQTTQVVGLAEVSDVARRILEGKIRGRVVVDVNL
jgi:NADPH:quinone reductase-like Zn-dependent oxidoreductase